MIKCVTTRPYIEIDRVQYNVSWRVAKLAEILVTAHETTVSQERLMNALDTTKGALAVYVNRLRNIMKDWDYILAVEPCVGYKLFKLHRRES